MTDSPSDAAAEATPEEPADQDPAAEAPEPSELESFAAEVAAQVGAAGWTADHGTAKLTVERAGWHQAVAAARDDAGLDFFSWLSAIDWSVEVAVGDPVDDPEALDERYEVLCGLSTLTDGRLVILSTDLPKDDATLVSITDLFEGAAWHEREAFEMFGIDFAGHPRLVRLYLPDAFEGHPLRKSFPLLSREVKPWPGLVDVEDMPSTENPEAATTESAASDAGTEGGAG